VSSFRHPRDTQRDWAAPLEPGDLLIHRSGHAVCLVMTRQICLVTGPRGAVISNTLGQMLAISVENMYWAMREDYWQRIS